MELLQRLDARGGAPAAARPILPAFAGEDDAQTLGVIRPLLAVLALAFCLRLFSALPFSAHHPDEIWQYLEPAYRLIEGRSVVTWDQRDGVRSWLLPQILSVPMSLGRALSPDTQAHLLAVRLFVAALSLLLVGAAWRLGSAVSHLHGLTAALLAAVWVEFVYMAPRVLTEPVSAYLFAAGAAVLLTRRGRYDYLAGLLLGLAVVFRIHTAPALAVLVLMNLGDWQRRLPRLMAGGVAALLVDVAANLAMGGAPFMWMVNNFTINILEGKAATFGTDGPLAYVSDLFGRWSFLVSPILFLAIWGARRYPSLLAAALTHLLVHSLIGHKEWRFDFLFHVLIIILAGIGTANLLERVSKQTAALLCVGWAAASAFVGLRQPMLASYTSQQGVEAAMQQAADVPPSCAIALYRLSSKLGGSHALLNEQRTFTTFRGPGAQEALAKSANAFGAVIAGQNRIAELPESFASPICFPGYGCVLKRKGGCSGSPPAELEINRWLRSAGV